MNYKPNKPIDLNYKHVVVIAPENEELEPAVVHAGSPEARERLQRAIARVRDGEVRASASNAPRFTLTVH